MGRNCSICEWASGGGGSEKYCTPSETQRTVVALRLEKCNVIKTKWKKLYRDGTEEKGEIHFCLVFFVYIFLKIPPSSFYQWLSCFYFILSILFSLIYSTLFIFSFKILDSISVLIPILPFYLCSPIHL